MKTRITAVIVLAMMLLTLTACSMTVPDFPKLTAPTESTKSTTTAVVTTAVPTSTAKPTTKPTETKTEVQTDAPAIIVNEPDDDTPSSQTYILNTNTFKFHYPSCSSASKTKDTNKQVYEGTREEVIAMGYEPCKRCNP